MSGAAAVNPYVAAADFGLGTVTDIIGMVMQLQSLQSAQQSAKAIDYRNFSYQKGRDKVSDRFNRDSMKIAKDKMALDNNRFAEEKKVTRYKIGQEEAQKAIDLLNADNQLRDRVLRNWSM